MSTAPRPSGGGELREEHQATVGNGKEGCAPPLNARTNGALRLEQRESCGDELLRFEFVDTAAPKSGKRSTTARAGGVERARGRDSSVVYGARSPQLDGDWNVARQA